MKQLRIWNRLSVRALLRPGQSIVVGRGSTAKISPATVHVAGTPEEIVKPRKITYRVQKGDSLSLISQRFKVTISKLKKWNDLKSSQYLQPGQELTLYVGLTADSESG